MSSLTSRSILYCILILMISDVHSDQCSSPPYFGVEDRSAWASWCRSCGGTVITGASPRCEPGSNWGGSSSGSSSSGGYTPSEQMALDAAGQVGAMIGNAMRESLFGSPQKDAERQAARELERVRAEQERLDREAEEEARKQRLLSVLQDVDSSPDLELMMDDNDHSVNTSLALELEDKPVYTTPTISSLDKNENSDPKFDDAAFNKGYLDGSQCFSSSAGNHCYTAQGEIHQECIKSYNAGFQKGEAIKNTLLAQARDAGINDKQQLRKNSGFSNSNAQGSCRTQWIESYNEGYAGAPALPLGR